MRRAPAMWRFDPLCLLSNIQLLYLHGPTSSGANENKTADAAARMGTQMASSQLEVTGRFTKII